MLKLVTLTLVVCLVSGVPSVCGQAGLQVLQDANLGYGIDEELGQLVSNYAPKVWLAKDEEYNPSSVDFHLQNVKVYDGTHADGYDRTPSTLQTCTESCYMSSTETLPGASDTLPFFGGEAVSSVRQPPVYALVKYGSHFTDIVYWMFYPYNRGKRVCIGIKLGDVCLGGYSTFGHHVGDWEHMTVRLNINGQPMGIYVSSHDFGGFYEWDQASRTFRKDDDIVQTEGAHPVLYSAWGSHGLWSTAGTHTYKRILIGEELQDETSEGTAWVTWRNLHAILYRRDGGYSGDWSWLNFKGRWGNRKSGCTVEALSGECILNNGSASINYRDTMTGDELD